MKNDQKLLHTVFKNVDYVDVNKNGETLKRYYAADGIEGMKRKDFESKLGEEFGKGIYKCTMYFKDGKRYPFNAKGIDNKPVSKPNTSNNSDVLNEIRSLKESISKKSNDPGTDLLLKMTNQANDVYVNSLKREVENLEKQLVKVETKLIECETQNESYRNELDEFDDKPNVVESILENPKLSALLEVGQKYLLTKFGKPVVTQLKESDQSDIPGEILQILGAVDWKQIPETNLNQLINGLRQYISLLPLKG